MVNSAWSLLREDTWPSKELTYQQSHIAVSTHIHLPAQLANYHQSTTTPANSTASDVEAVQEPHLLDLLPQTTKLHNTSFTNAPAP